MKRRPNNRLQWTGTLKGGQASKVLSRLVVLRKRSPAPEPGVRQGQKDMSIRPLCKFIDIAGVSEIHNFDSGNCSHDTQVMHNIQTRRI